LRPFSTKPEMSPQSIDDARGSVSAWIAQLKDGEADAARRLWEHYASRLTAAARRWLAGAPTGIADEEDVAQSVFALVCRGAQSGRLQDVATRDDLWWLLLLATKRRAIDQRRREGAAKRGGAAVAREAHLAEGEPQFTLDCLAGSNPTPEFLVMMQEQTERLLGLLRDDLLRTIAMARMEGLTVAEIAASQSIGLRSVERKLALIRGKWRKELDR